jgi:hypothetical protein
MEIDPFRGARERFALEAAFALLAVRAIIGLGIGLLHHGFQYFGEHAASALVGHPAMLRHRARCPDDGLDGELIEIK